MSQSNALAQTIQAVSNDNEAQDPARLAELMNNPDYLRQSSALINEALQKGFDVIQMPNGDIVTTGTKVIVNTYKWDEDETALNKAKTTSTTQGAQKKVKIDLDDEDDDE